MKSQRHFYKTIETQLHKGELAENSDDGSLLNQSQSGPLGFQLSFLMSWQVSFGAEDQETNGGEKDLEERAIEMT